MQTNKTMRLLSLALIGAMLCGIPAVRAARVAKGARPAGEGEAAGGGPDYQAVRLFRRAGELLSAGESERGLKMMETILDQYPKDAIRFEIWLAMGRHYHEIHEQAKAIDTLRNLDQLKKPGEEIQDKKLKDIYVEALYIAGVCHFETRQYSKRRGLGGQHTHDGHTPPHSHSHILP